jgi:hypothetical protein
MFEYFLASQTTTSCSYFWSDVYRLWVARQSIEPGGAFRTYPAVR